MKNMLPCDDPECVCSSAHGGGSKHFHVRKLRNYDVMHGVRVPDEDRLTASTGLPFVVTRKSKAAKFEQAVNRLMAEIVAGEESAEHGGWIDESEILSNNY